jgi:tetratricopeptide (TPR) repeat protein
MQLKYVNIVRTLSLMALIALSIQVRAQQTTEQKQLALARQFMQEKSYEKAVPIFKELYNDAPFDKTAYHDYLNALLLTSKFDDAEALVQYMAKIRREDPVIYIDLGDVYTAAGKKKKATEQYDLAVEKVSGEDFRTSQIADAFAASNNTEYAIKVYKRARVLIQNQYLYGTQLALLYSKEGNTEEAINAMMDVLVTQPNELDNTKSSLLQVVDGDEKKLAIVQKQLFKRIGTDPANPYWNELLTWLYVQKGDYEGALKQILLLDKTLNENGERIVRFASDIKDEGQTPIALRAFQYVMDKGKEHPMYEDAWNGKIQVMEMQLESKKPVDPALLHSVLKEYQAFLITYPQYFITPFIRNYAKVQARFAGNIDTAITVLQQAVDAPNTRREFVGYCKLDLGDYYLLQDKVWDATLLYSQVDKNFKEDLLGEEARFRNAKLAYYRGDFKWAQDQLSVLKASTTELIANDALYLSVLITENSPADSNIVPLTRFAVADMMLFQNKTKESDQLLDSIATHYPQSELQDDILLLRAKIALEEGRNTDAIAFLEKIVKSYGDDVLGDDAVFILATIFEERIKDIPKALEYYEKLITDYPGSTYIQTARIKYQKLKSGKTAS